MKGKKAGNEAKLTINSFSHHFSGEKYESCIQECFVKNVDCNYKYILKYEGTVNQGVQFSFIVVMKNGDGLTTSKKYIEYGREFSLTEGTTCVSVELFSESFSVGSIELRNITLEKGSKLESRKVKLAAAAISYINDVRTTEKNVNENLDAIDNAAKEGADLILLTECFYCRNVFPDSERKILLLSLEGEEIRLFRERAKKHRIYIAFSVFIKEENGNVSNMGIIIGRNGETVGTYKKTHLTIHEKNLKIEPGREVKVFDLDFGKVGFAICWDLFFPEFTRVLQLKDVEIILNPSGGYKKERLIERACETGAYILSSGMHKESDSRITAPDGSFLAIGSSEKNYICSTVDLSDEFYIPWLSTSTSATMENVFRYERKPELYRERG